MDELKSESMKAEQSKEQNKDAFAPDPNVLFKGTPFEAPVIRRYPMDISIPRNLKAELSIGGDLRKEDLEKLKRQVERLIENLADAFED